MARKVSDNFNAGMITDVIGMDGSVQELVDMYVRRAGELATRGPIVTDSQVLSGMGYQCGWSQADFHPNIGIIGSYGSVTAASAATDIGAATEWRMLAAPLRPTGTDDDFTFYPITEGATLSEVVLNAGVATAASAVTGLPFEKIVQTTRAGSQVIMAGELGALYKWGGSLAAAYNTGTVSIASTLTATRIITGSGTTWSGNVQEGQYIMIDGIGEGADGNQRSFLIKKVVDNDTLEIELPIYSTASHSGLTYRIQSASIIQSQDGVWNGTDERPRSVGICAYHSDKLWTAGVSNSDSAYNTVYDLDEIMFSGTLDESGNVADDSTFHHHIDLWGNTARFRVFPGIGGSIRGLVSFGNDLIVIKSHGVFRVTGAQSVDGLGGKLAQQIISSTVGGNGYNAFCVTNSGIVMASTDGLYVYEGGGGLKSLTGGRVGRWWEDVLGGKEYSLVAFEDKVIISSTDTSITTKLVYDIEQDYFWVMKTDDYNYTTGVSVYASNDEWVGDFVFQNGKNTSFNAQNEISWKNVTHINHKKGWDAQQSNKDNTGTQYPQASIITQPMGVHEDRSVEGRANNIFIHSSVKASTSTKTMDVSIHTGASYLADSSNRSAAEFYGQSLNLEYGVNADDTDNLETTQRITVDGFDASNFFKIKIKARNTDGDEGLGLRIYSITLDSRTDSSFESGEA